MIPAIGSEAEARLQTFFDPAITDIRADSFADRNFTLLSGHDDEARALGIEMVGAGDVTVVVTDRTRKLGRLQVESGGRDNTLFFDNLAWGGNCFGNIRILGSDCALLFNDIADGYVALPTIFLRSSSQILFWGRGATAVGFSIELEGIGQSVVIGDDALISSGVWVRNYDMHAMHDLRTGGRLNRPPVDTVLERHVWLGQDALLLGCERVGMGSIVGARALLKGTLPPRVVAAGTPARIVRNSVSWGRDTYAMTEAERVAIGMPATPET